MKPTLIVLSALAIGILAGGARAAHRPTAGAMSCCLQTAAAQPDRLAATVTNDLPQATTLVFSNYFKIQAALAEDSLEGVASHARAISKAVKDDATSAFPPGVADQAEALAAGATNLADARDAFQPFSDSLIKFASKHPALGATYRHFHCPMVNADWLQTNLEVHNPYTGPSMGGCGELVN